MEIISSAPDARRARTEEAAQAHRIFATSEAHPLPQITGGRKVARMVPRIVATHWLRPELAEVHHG